MNYLEFSKKIKAKYPEYADVDDMKLAKAMVAKYPEYAEKVTFDGQQQITQADVTSQSELIKPMMQSDPGGLYQYTISIDGEPINTISKNERIDKNYMRDYMAEYGNVDPSMIEIQESIADDPSGIARELQKKGWSADISDVARTPQRFKQELLGGSGLAKFGATLGDVASYPGRGLLAAIDGVEGGSYEERLGKTATTADSFLGQIGQGILQSAATPFTFGLGGAAMSGARSTLGAMARGSALGGAEGAIDVGYQGLSQEGGASAGDIATGAGLSAGFAGGGSLAIPKLIEGARKGINLAAEVPLATAGLFGKPGEMLEGAGREMLGMQAPLLQRLKKPAPPVVDQGSYDVFKRLKLRDDQMPSSITHGTESAIHRAEQSLSESRWGQPYLDRFDAAFKVIDDEVDLLTRRQDALTPMAAGNDIVDAFEAARAKLFRDNSTTYNSIASDPVQSSMINDAIRSKGASYTNMIESLEKVEQNLLNQLESAVQKEDIRAINGALETISNTKQKLASAIGDESKNVFSIMNGIRDRIGRLAYDPKFNRLEILETEMRSLRDIEKSMRNAISDAVGEVDPNLQSQLLQSNQNMADFLGKQEILKKAIGNDMLGGEKVLKSTFGDTKKAAALKQTLESQGLGSEWDNIAKSWFSENILGVKGINDTYNYQSILNRLEKNKDMVSLIYDEVELDNLLKTIRAGRDIGNRTFRGSGGQAEFSRGVIEDAIKTTSAKAVLGAQKVAKKPISSMVGRQSVAKDVLGMPAQISIREMVRQQAYQPPWENEQ